MYYNRRRSITSPSGGGGISISTLAIIALFLSIINYINNDVQLRFIGGVSASAVAPPTIMTARLKKNTRRELSTAKIINTSSTATLQSSESSTATIIEQQTTTAAGSLDNTSTSTETKKTTNPIGQLANYVKTTIVNFKNGLGQMNTDHKRCNNIRTKQRTYAITQGTKRPRGLKGVQTGGITYEEYDFLRKGLVDRNKLFAVVMVSLCLPNYFVYYLWSFPDMMPSPFLKGSDSSGIDRERNHAVISTLLDIEKGARVAPWTSKLNPFGRKATERAMARLDNFITMGCNVMEEYGASGPAGGKLLLKKLKMELYTSTPLTKQQKLLAGNIIPKQIMKGLSKAIGADPLNKGSSPFGIGTVKHIESVTLADEFLVNQGVDIDTINDQLLAEACSARLIGNPGWSTEERRDALTSWLQETEIKPKERVTRYKNSGDIHVHYNANLARAALMCYNAVDGTRDVRSDARLTRAMYQGQQKEFILN